MSGRVAPAAKPRRGASGLWVQGMVCGLLATLATPTAVLGALLLAPAGLAWLLDREPGRPAARPVLLAGLAASVQPLVALWTTGHTLTNALALAGDLGAVAIAWAAQATGWLASEVVPLIATLAAEATVAARIRKLRAQRRALEEEWGLPATAAAAERAAGGSPEAVA